MTPVIDIFSKDISELQSTKNILQKEGFDVYIYSAVNENSINSIYKDHPDIILVDMEINNSDGIELCYQLKKENALNSYIVVYTDHEEEYIQIEAFKAGADDYIIKPINPRLLIKRLNALLKRKPLNLKKKKPTIVSFSKLKIDRESYMVIYEDKEISLPRKEFEILYLLINTPQKVFSREEIFNKVWKKSNCDNTRIIDVHVRKIREKVHEDIINTVKGVGYQLSKHQV